MPTAQGSLNINKESQGEPSTLYITLSHLPCQTKRTFKIKRTLDDLLDSKIQGFFITSKCQKCGSGVMVQVFNAREIKKGWTYSMPIHDVGELTVHDDMDMMKEVK